MDYKFITDSNIVDRIVKRELKNGREGFVFDKYGITIYYTVKCLHCGRYFTANELRVAKDNPGEYAVLCKYAPECDGNIEDMIPITELAY